MGFEAQAEAWLDAARYVDEKWEHAFARADRVRAGFASLVGNAGGGIALGSSTHELVVRLLSALPLRDQEDFLKDHILLYFQNRDRDEE